MKRPHIKRAAAYVLITALLIGNLSHATSVSTYASAKTDEGGYQVETQSEEDASGIIESVPEEELSVGLEPSNQSEEVTTENFEDDENPEEEIEEKTEEKTDKESELIEIADEETPLADEPEEGEEAIPVIMGNKIRLKGMAPAASTETVTVSVIGVDDENDTVISLGVLSDNKPEYDGYDFVEARVTVDGERFEVYAIGHYTEEGDGVYYVTTSADAVTGSIIEDTKSVTLVYEKKDSYQPVSYIVMVDGKAVAKDVKPSDEALKPYVSITGAERVATKEDYNFVVKEKDGYKIEKINAVIEGEECLVKNKDNNYQVSEVKGPLTVKILLKEKTTYSISFQGSNVTVTFGTNIYISGYLNKTGTDRYGQPVYESITNSYPVKYTYTADSAISFSLAGNYHWGKHSKKMNQLTITIDKVQHTVSIPDKTGDDPAKTSIGKTLTVTVKRTGDGRDSDGNLLPTYDVTIQSTDGNKVRGEIDVNINYKKIDSSEVWAKRLEGVESLAYSYEGKDSNGNTKNGIVTSDKGSGSGVDVRLSPDIFSFYDRSADNRYKNNSYFYFKIKDGYEKDLRKFTLQILSIGNDGTVKEITPSTRLQNINSSLKYYNQVRSYDGYFVLPGESTLENYDIRIYITYNYEEESYRIAYDAGEGTGAPEDEKVYQLDGNVLVAEKTPTRAGYRFAGWELDGETYKSGDVLTIDKTLADKADRTAKPYTITLKAKWEEAQGNTKALYTVKVYFADEDGNYPEKETASFPQEGVVGSKVQLFRTKTEDEKFSSLKGIPEDWKKNWEYDRFDNEDKIKADCTTVVKVYYRRASGKLVIKKTFEGEEDAITKAKEKMTFNIYRGTAKDIAGNPVKELKWNDKLESGQDFTLPIGTYTVIEKGADVKSYTRATKVNNESVDGNEPFAEIEVKKGEKTNVTFVNSYGKTMLDEYVEFATLSFKKVEIVDGETQEPLNGAVFGLTKVDAEGNAEEIVTSISGPNEDNEKAEPGVVEFVFKKEGFYILKEIKAPFGYEKDNREIKIEVTRDNENVKVERVDTQNEAGWRKVTKLLYKVIGPNGDTETLETFVNEPETTKLTGKKVWIDGKPDGAHNNEQEVHLEVYYETMMTDANGDVSRKETVVKDNNYNLTWDGDAFTITGLRKYPRGATSEKDAFIYQIKEKDVEGYTTEITKDNDGSFAITNTSEWYNELKEGAIEIIAPSAEKVYDGYYMSDTHQIQVNQEDASQLKLPDGFKENGYSLSYSFTGDIRDVKKDESGKVIRVQNKVEGVTITYTYTGKDGKEVNEDVTEQWKKFITTTDGELKVTPRTLTITTESDSRPYNGTALTAPGTIDGFANDDEKRSVTFEVTGSVIGSATATTQAPNTYSLTFSYVSENGAIGTPIIGPKMMSAPLLAPSPKDGAVANKVAYEDNYVIVENIGTLTVTPLPTTGGDPGDDGGGTTPGTPDAPVPTATTGETGAVLGVRREMEGVTAPVEADGPAVLGARRGVSTGDDSNMFFWAIICLAALTLMSDRYAKIKKVKGTQ